jgi:hypothetical protein
MKSSGELLIGYSIWSESYMIVKIQASQYTTAGQQQMLIYNEDSSFQMQEPITKEIKEALGNRVKAYFIAEIIDNELVIIEETITQDW